MVGWENGDKDEPSAGSTENQVPIFRNHEAENKDLFLHQFLGLLLAFIQEIRYYVPSLSEKGKVILEFWVPSRILVENFGDCDSD